MSPSLSLSIYKGKYIYILLREISSVGVDVSKESEKFVTKSV